jgi:NADP-reducing hydrogenase subunit HndB
MPGVRTLEDLKRLKEEALEMKNARMTQARGKITVGMGTCSIAAGAETTMTAILKSIEEEDLSGVVVQKTGCRGLCEWEPVVEVGTGNAPCVTYGKVSSQRAEEIIKEHIMGEKVVAAYLIPA